MILKYRFPIITLALLLTLLFLQKSAIKYYWYVKFPPLDIFMHLLGGICIALSVFYVLKNTRHIIFFTILGGVAWELLELYFHISGHPFGTTLYYVDTTKDMIMDTLGAVMVYFILRKK
jgi:hypothetical protein